jgi:hypothetical protein
VRFILALILVVGRAFRIEEMCISGYPLTVDIEILFLDPSVLVCSCKIESEMLRILPESRMPTC